MGLASMSDEALMCLSQDESPFPSGCIRTNCTVPDGDGVALLRSTEFGLGGEEENLENGLGADAN